MSVNGVSLHYLDWGGDGQPLLLLAGLFGSAHGFDEIAPVFARDFHVLALTRRGHGKSDAQQPATRSTCSSRTFTSSSTRSN